MKKIYVPIVTMIMLFTLVLGASAGGGYEPAAWDATENSKTVGVVAGEILTGNGLITGDGDFVCAGEDEEVTAAELADGTDLLVYGKQPVIGEAATVAVLIKANGAPFTAGESISVTVQNGTDTAGVGFTAYNCAGVSLPDEALNLLNAYAPPAAPAPAPATVPDTEAPVVVEPVESRPITMTNWAQFDPTIYESTKLTAITGTYTVTVAGDFSMFGVDDAATSVTHNGNEILANCTVNVKMQGELLRTVVCPGPFAEGDVVIVAAKDTKGGGTGVYAQSGVNRFAGTYQNWDAANKALVLTDIMPDESAAQAEAAMLAPVSNSRLDTLEARQADFEIQLDALEVRMTDIEAMLQTLFEQIQLILARLPAGQ